MLQISEITDINHPDFPEALQIYIDSFPANERHDSPVIEQRIENKFSQLFVGKLQDRVACIALLYQLNHPKFILLDYLGTDQNYRSQGLGTQIMEYLFKILEKSQKTLIIEVENPDYGDDREEKVRRVKFYKRLGGKILKNVRYILPALSGDIPTEMILMVLPEYQGGKIEGELVKVLIKQMYKEVYNRDESDRLLNSFINDIGESVELI